MTVHGVGHNTDRNAELFERAHEALPGGVSHELRYRRPTPIYVTRADGATKEDANGRRYIDYKMGSASLLLGHRPKAVMDALADQLSRTPFTADCHELEIDWAERVNALFPCAERCRFTASGTEATMLALRLGRAFSGRDGVLRIDGHYHGWHDHLLKGAKPNVARAPSHGVPAAISDLVTAVPPDLDAVRDALDADADIGTVIVEVSGANYGSVPLPDGFLRGLRPLTRERDHVLVFDEIITGFRWSPGGLQARDGVVPDLATLAKILTGGLPGGAVIGRSDIMDWLDPGETRAGLAPGVTHKGTFNASPLVAAGAIASLDCLADGAPQAHADAMAERLRAGLNAILDARGLPGAAYGESSTFHLYLGPCEGRDVRALDAATIRGVPAGTVNALRAGLLERGIDLMSHSSGVTSSAHETTHVDETLDAFDAVLGDLASRGMLAG